MNIFVFRVYYFIAIENVKILLYIIQLSEFNLFMFAFNLCVLNLHNSNCFIIVAIPKFKVQIICNN